MPLQPARKVVQDPPPPIERDFPPLLAAGVDIPVRVIARLSEDGVWRGRIVFGGTFGPVLTAEILCAASESDLWASARGLGPHHLRSLFQSLTTPE
ncbi:MAG TPA: hypothetical protein VL295_01880 [Gemmatimonadales bacterium]|jgi:hypothetical protein|nr:hypothetical protein [Gemmatimonadales bacterium]